MQEFGSEYHTHLALTRPITKSSVFLTLRTFPGLCYRSRCLVGVKELNGTTERTRESKDAEGAKVCSQTIESIENTYCYIYSINKDDEKHNKDHRESPENFCPLPRWSEAILIRIHFLNSCSRCWCYFRTNISLIRCHSSNKIGTKICDQGDSELVNTS